MNSVAAHAGCGPPRCSFWLVTLEQGGIVFVHFDELGQVLDAEVGERQDAVFSDPDRPR